MTRKKFGKRIACVILMAAMCLGTLAGCGSESSTQGGTNIEAEEGGTQIFTDSLGRQVELPANITRIVPSGDLAQQFLLAIAPDKMVACSGGWSNDAEEYLDEAYLELPDLGSFFGSHDLSYEEIAKLNPQVIIDVGETKDSMADELDMITEKTGIPAVHISAELETVDEAFLMLGELLGEEEQGKALHDYCLQAYNETKTVMEQVDADGARKSLLYCLGENGMNVLARDSYQSAIIDMVSDNKAVVANPSAKGSGNETDIEQILGWNPEVIIFAPNGYYEYASMDSVWQPLDAIKNDTYYEVPIGPYNWMGFPPGSNRVMGMLWLTDLLYPEYTNYDIKDKVVQYYKLFYHCDLTDEQYEALVGNSILKEQAQ